MNENPNSDWLKAIELQEQRVREETEKLLQLHREQAPRKIKDYTLQTKQGARLLSSYFGDKNEMWLVHNMGKRCVYCTLWADGLTGFAPHLRDRAALLLVNGDSVATQTEFAEGRGWNFPYASSEGTSLFADMGFHSPKDGMDHPGVSVITRDDAGQMWQKTAAGFGPGDLFCDLWNFVGLLPSNVDWNPKYKY